MTTDVMQEQACLYAAGALPPHEVRAFEEALRHDAHLRKLVAELQDAAEVIALDAPAVPPPLGLKQRLFEQIDAAPTNVVVADFTARRAVFWIPLALAASIAALCVVLVLDRNGVQQENAALAAKLRSLESNAATLRAQTSLVQSQAEQIARLQGQLQSAAERMMALSTQALALQNQQKENEALRRELQAANRRNTDLAAQGASLRTQVATLEAAQRASGMQIALLKSQIETPDTVGVSVWDRAHQKGVFVADKLPPLPEDKQYQLWVLDPKYQSPVSAGVFSVDATGHARLEFAPTLPVDRTDRLAVSVERRGGVPSPEGRIVLITQ